MQNIERVNFFNRGQRNRAAQGFGTNFVIELFTPQGAEKLLEIYYRYRLSPQVEISPDFQYVANGGGNNDAKAIKVFALRANIAY